MRRPNVVDWIVAFAVYFTVLAVAEFVIGAHDAALARSGLGVAISSFLLLASSALLAASAVQLVHLSRRGRWKCGKRPPCKPLVLIAFLGAGLLGIYLILSALKTPSEQRPVVVAIGAVILAVAVAGLLVFGRDARTSLPRLGGIALGLIGTTIGAWQFWFQNQYVPAHAGRAVSLAAHLVLVRPDKKDDVVRAFVSYEALGKSDVAVIGSTYTLTGSKVVRCHRPANLTTVGEPFLHFEPDPQTSRFAADTWEIRKVAILAAGKFVGDGKRLDQNVPAARELVFSVPRHRYQLLRFRAQLFAIPGSVPLSQRRLLVIRRLKGDSELYGLWHLDDDSWLHDIAFGRERWVVLRYELVDPGNTASSNVTPALRVTARFPDPTWSDREPSRAEIKRLFSPKKPLQTSDSSEPFGDAELALEPVTNPTPKEKGVPKRCFAKKS